MQWWRKLNITKFQSYGIISNLEGKIVNTQLILIVLRVNSPAIEQYLSSGRVVERAALQGAGG